MFTRNYYIMKYAYYYHSGGSGSYIDGLMRLPATAAYNLLPTKGNGTIVEQYPTLSPAYYQNDQNYGWGTINSSISFDHKFSNSHPDGYLSFNITTMNNNSNIINPSGYHYLKLVIGEGNANDTTPVTLLDQDITNKVFDDRITFIITKAIDTINISMTNITNQDINIREIGIYSQSRIDDVKNDSTYSQLLGDFINEVDSNNIIYIPILIYKVKLTTPIVVSANSTKSVSLVLQLP